MTDKKILVAEEKYQKIADKYGQILLKTAKDSIFYGLSNDRAMKVNLKNFDDELKEFGASFVTLKETGSLRGCIGTVVPFQPLIQDVAENAFNAAFRDPRFNMLSLEEFGKIKIYISILTPMVEIKFKDEKDLISKIRKGKDGLLLEVGSYKGLFLPSVWEDIDDEATFLTHLKLKARLPMDFWSNAIKVKKFSSVCVT